MNKKIYFSVEENFEKTSLDLYKSSRSILSHLNENSDLYLVNPKDYDINNMKIKRAFRYINPSKIEQVLDTHTPTGDTFVIYGDETSKNIGLEFARNQYQFLKNLQTQRNFINFINTPSTEELTLKHYLEELSKDDSLMIAKSKIFEKNSDLEEMIKKYNQVIIKPIFGCRGSGVIKIDSCSNIENLNLEEMKNQYIIQEPLYGDEKRVIFLGNSFLASRIHKNRAAPWDNNWGEIEETYEYKPSLEEINITKKIQKKINADLIGVDFIGNKVNEVNGTGTGIIMYNHQGKLLYNKSKDVAEYILKK